MGKQGHTLSSKYTNFIEHLAQSDRSTLGRRARSLAYVARRSASVGSLFYAFAPLRFAEGRGGALRNVFSSPPFPAGRPRPQRIRPRSESREPVKAH